MKSTVSALLICVSAVFSVSALGAWRDIPSMDFQLAPYPELGSEASDKDFEELLRLQTSRTKAQCRQGQRQKWPEFGTLFRSEILDPDEFEAVRPLMEQAGNFTERVANYHKGKFDRPRPFTTNPNVKPCVDKPTGAKSYPSSHAAISMAVSCLLSEVFPAKADDLRGYGQELGDLRAVIGVHHPSDVLAGQKLGFEICERLKSEPDFAQELAKLRQTLEIAPQ